MDPNTTLDELRSWMDGESSGRPAPERVEEFAELFAALDDWLCRDGFLPAAWAPTGLRKLIDAKNAFIDAQHDEDGGEPLCGYPEYDERITTYARDVMEAVDSMLGD